MQETHPTVTTLRPHLQYKNCLTLSLANNRMTHVGGWLMDVTGGTSDPATQGRKGAQKRTNPDRAVARQRLANTRVPKKKHQPQPLAVGMTRPRNLLRVYRAEVQWTDTPRNDNVKSPAQRSRHEESMLANYCSSSRSLSNESITPRSSTYAPGLKQKHRDVIYTYVTTRRKKQKRLQH